MNTDTRTTEPVILLTGVSGQVGWELERTLANLGRVVPCNRDALDLADAESIRKAVRAIRPDLIVNAAAYTSVDKAEQDRPLAEAINARAPGVLAEEAHRIGAAIVHYSTDYVFSGAEGRPYTERDEPDPVNVYGATKLAGERAIMTTDAAAIVLRTSWVYGLRGRNFLLTVQRLARERDSLSVVDDQVGAPTWCRSIAEATAQIVAQARGKIAEHVMAHRGVYHLSCAGNTSWYGFARKILAFSEGAQNSLTIRPIPAAEYPTPARRPAYSVLDNQRLADTFGIRLPPWETALGLALEAPTGAPVG